LHLAAAYGHVELTRLLLANGADPHAIDRWGLTPISEAERKAARVGSDPIMELFKEGGHIPPEKESIWSFFSVFFGAWEVMMMILIGLFCQYGENAIGGEHDDHLKNSTGTAYTTVEEFRDPLSVAQANFNRVYACYQDVHVMIFIGFAFLMVFLRKHGYTSVGLTFLIGAFVIQWYQLTLGFWENVFSGSGWNKIPIGIEQLVRGDFCAGSVLITFGVLLGKVNPSQILFISIIETILFSLNESIGLQIGVDDVGGTMTIHMFGAFFGYGCTWMLTPKEAYGHENNAANYHSDIMAMIGTIFLWMFWPSFNGALCVANAQERAVVNTLLSLCGSCVVAFIASHVFRGHHKFFMVDIQNATLAGGVAMGACADLLIEPGSAVGIGGVAGLVSVLGFVYVQPVLEQKIGLHDTCGVNNLHGMPSIIGGFASVIAASVAHVDGFGGHDGYGRAQLGNAYPHREVDAFTGNGRSANTQAAIQFAYMLTSIGIGLLGGLIAGHFATLRCFKPTDPKTMYIDSEYWEVPEFETPYYFDHRGEVARDPAGAAIEKALLTEGGSEEDAVETSKVEGANLDAPDNAQLLNLIQTLETRLNQLTRRIGQSGGINPSSLPATTPLTGLSAIPQAHLTKSAAPIETEYPASKLAVSVPSDSTTTVAASSIAPLTNVSVVPNTTTTTPAVAATPTGASAAATSAPLMLHAEDEHEDDEE
jgi:ammonium transporter Rh